MVTKLGDRNKAVRQQIEFLLDNAEERVFEVILKAGRSNGQEDEFNRTVANALRKRSLSVSPRDVLPAAWHALDAGRRSENQTPSRAADRHLRAAGMSISAQMARSLVADAPARTLKSATLAAMQPVLDSSVVREALALDQSRSRKRNNTAEEPPVFWTSGSVLLRMKEDDLLKLSQDDAVEAIEGVYPNRRISVPPAVAPKQVPPRVEDNKVSAWGVRTTGALATWGAFDARGKGIRIGLLDTGVSPKHPDLQDKITTWAEFDGQGKLVSGSKTARDSDQHGTHCAGIMVGGNNSGRWIGMAPEADIAAALVLDGKKGGTDAQVLAGIDWAIEQGVDVINMSLGGLIWGPEVPSTYTSAILNAMRMGIPVVTAIGNEGSQTSGSPGNDFLAFAVGAVDVVDRAAGFTGGRTQVIKQSPFFPPDMLPLVYSKPDLSAPGVAVYSSIPGDKWEYFNGTSMAAPHVAGAIALLLSATSIKTKVPRSERAFVIQDLLTGSAEELGEAGQDHRFGFGKIDILRAIGFAKDLGY